MIYPIVIHKDRQSAYGVSVPDLPGCFSAGDTLDEAMVMAKEAILGHLEALLETGQPIPKARPAEEHQRNKDFADATYWSAVDVDLASVPGRTRRINISMNERILDRVDAYARKSGESRSGLLTRAVTEYIARDREASHSVPRRRHKQH